MKKLLIGVLLATAAAISLRAGEVLASSFGFNAVDATECLQKAFDSGATVVRIDRQASDWVIRPVFLRSNQTVIIDPDVTIRAKKGEFKALNDSLFTISDAENVTVKGGRNSRLLMNKRDYQDKSQYRHSEWRMLISINSSKNVTLDNLILEGSGGDGVYVGLGKKRTAPENIVLKNLNVRDNHRQGISIISAKNLLISNCDFYETSGTAPQAGIDFEPNYASEKLENCVVENCRIYNNRTYGILFHLNPLLSTSAPISVTIRNCQISDGEHGAVVIDSCASMSQVKGNITFENCMVSGNEKTPHALIIRNQRADGFSINFKNCRFDNSKMSSNAVKIISETNSNIGNIDFRNVSITDNKRDKWDILESSGAKPQLTGTIDFNGGKIDLAAWSKAQKVVAQVLFIPAKLDIAKFAAPAAGKGKTAPGFRFRGAMTFLQYAKAGETIEFTVSNNKLGTRGYPVNLECIDPAGKKFKNIRLETGENKVSFTAPATGVYQFCCRTSTSICFDSAMPGQGMAAKKLGMFATRHKSLYFEVPEGAKEVMIYLKGNDGEAVSAKIYNHKGQLMGEFDKITLGMAFRHTRVFTGREIWRIDFPFMREDSEIELGGDLNPVLALTPELLLQAK